MVSPDVAVGTISNDAVSLEAWHLLDHCDEALLVVDPSLRIVYANARVAKLAPYPVAGRVGRALIDVFPDMVGTRFEQEIRAAMIGRDPRSFVADYAPLGRRLRARCMPLQNELLAVFFRDVVVQTDARSEEADAFRTLMNIASDWMYELNTENVYTYVSPSVTTTLGYEPGELLGKTPWDLIPPDYLQSIEPMFARIAATQTSFAGLECAYRAKNGELVYQESSGSPTYDALGNWTGYRGVKHNITAQKRREAMLESVAQKQSKIAEVLQRSLLQTPRHVTLPHIEVVTRYEAASPDALIGGDLFDVYALHDGKVALVVGDVTGKGVEAATDMAEIKFLLRSYLRETSEPEAALVRLNRQLFLRRTLSERGANALVCLSVAVLDTNTGTAQFAVAGMESPLLIRVGQSGAEPTLERVTMGGLPLGVLPAWQPDAGQSASLLAPGDLLLLYTDGVIAARSKGDSDLSDPVFGTARLLQSVRMAATATLTTTSPTPVAGICDAVLAAVQRFTGSERRDDICLLLARFLPECPPVLSKAVPLAVPEGDDVIVSRCDADWRYTYFTPNVERFTGQLRSELLGKTVWDAFPAFVDTSFEQLARRARAENVTLVANMELIPPGILYRVACVPLPSGELEIRSLCLTTEKTADLSRELEVMSREREIALREREAALRERETALREYERSREYQRRFLTDVLANVTEGRLRLCHRLSDLSAPLPLVESPFALTSAAELAPLRRLLESAAQTVGLPPARALEFAMAVGEAAMNCVVHGGGGVATLHGDPQIGRLQVRIVDTGTGIAEESLHRATLERGFTTAGSLGLGFSMMYSTADRVYLLTGATGTTVLLEQNVVPPEPAFVGY